MATRKKTTSSAAPTNPLAAEPLQRHPYSEMFSLPMGEDEREALAEHIATNKQISPIVLYEGQVLDGWERYLACRRKGVTPEFKTYDGPNPAAVAFGANVMRRRLSVVQKALMGAKYLLRAQEAGEKVTQKDIAKQTCCSLQRLNAMVQLIRAADSNEAAARALSTLNTNPDVTYAQVQDMLVEAGIVDQNARAPVTPPKPAAADNDEHDPAADDAVDSLLGDDVDELLGDAGIDDDSTAPRSRKARDEDDTETSSVGIRRRDPSKRPTETPASALAQSFKALTEPERVQFVCFAWGVLRPTLEKAAAEGRIEFPALGVQADAGRTTMADMAAALAGGAPLPVAAAPAERGRKGRKRAHVDI